MVETAAVEIRKTCCGHYSLERGGARDVGIFTISTVIPGLVPGIHVFQRRGSSNVMAGTSPAMTTKFG